jgi:HEPN domain
VSWEQGRAVIEQLLDDRHLEQVPADPVLAKDILDQAKSHLIAAERVSSIDPYIAYSALYDAARKALTALLQAQGLRPTRGGGHVAVIDAARAQMVPPLAGILRPMHRMRRTRHDAEYPSAKPISHSITSTPTYQMLARSSTWQIAYSTR